MERSLNARLRRDEGNASQWRLLGRVQLELGKLESAHQSLERAVALDNMSAAAHYDLARVLVKLDHESEAIAHFRSSIRIAEESSYADEARIRLVELGEEPVAEPTDEVIQTGYAVRQFGALEKAPSERLGQRAQADEPENLYVRVDTGVLYNSNIALTPISRSLFPGNRDSVQVFISPTIDYQILSKQSWTAGTTFNGDFNLNEGDFREFNLQSYRPGAYIEKSIDGVGAIWTPRLQYEFAHDAFEGIAFGNRHAVTASLASYWERGGTSFAYWTTDYTDFVSDGILPSVTSRDGITHAIGFSHTLAPYRRFLDTVTTGIDLRRADVEGSDFAFDGLSVFTEAQIPIVATVELTLRGGWGYRDYRRFEFVPSRNENVWQAGGELRKRFSEHVSIAAVVDYDFFDSDNVLFAAERYVAGLQLRLEN